MLNQEKNRLPLTVAMNKIEITKARPNDAEMLAGLSFRTFWDAFHGHPLNDPDDMEAYMSAAFSPAQMRIELEDPRSLFLVARDGENPVGYAKLLFDNLEEPVKSARPVELCRLYSETSYIGRGIGQALMDACLRAARERGCDVVWLGVWEHNPRARRFYEKNGFAAVGKHVFQLGSDPQTDDLMALRLEA
jgi:ribosomal protein S18 acetylase RimI-like enzyme